MSCVRPTVYSSYKGHSNRAHPLSARLRNIPWTSTCRRIAVPDRVSITEALPANTRKTYAQLDGPGCIRHIWVALTHPQRLAMSSRKAVIRIYFDEEPVPYVEAPVGDFFGVMHGLGFYPIDSHFLSVKAWNGYSCYFAMPFARSARIEFEAGPEGNQVFLQVDWQRYPGQALTERRRFCARWRREMPTQRYGEEFLMVDADGPGQLLGFVYGVRLLDDVGPLEPRRRGEHLY